MHAVMRQATKGMLAKSRPEFETVNM